MVWMLVNSLDPGIIFFFGWGMYIFVGSLSPGDHGQTRNYLELSCEIR